MEANEVRRRRSRSDCYSNDEAALAPNDDRVPTLQPSAPNH